MNHWMEHLKKLRKENPKLSFKEILKLGKKSYKKSKKQHKKSMKHEKKSKKQHKKSIKHHKKSIKHHKKSKKGGAKSYLSDPLNDDFRNMPSSVLDGGEEVFQEIIE